MRPYQYLKERPRVFIAAKAAVTIPVGHELIGDALVQAALDPAIRAIEFIPTVAAYGKVVALDAIVYRYEDGRQVLDIVETRPLRSLDDEGLALLAIDQLGLAKLTLTAGDIRRQPRAANSSQVWNCRHYGVFAPDRVHILQMLNEDGPMPLARLGAEARCTRDPIATAFAMACLNLIELDLTSIPLGPETSVRRRITNGDNK
jgi:hypothetical protein